MNAKLSSLTGTTQCHSFVAAKVIRRAIFASAVFVILNVPPSGAFAAVGELDTTFAAGGTSRVGFSGGEEFADAIAVQSDGKLVLAGRATSQTLGAFQEFEILRLGTNNLPDDSFGVGGVVLTSFGITSSTGLGSSATAVQIQPDGKIVAAGGMNSDGGLDHFALARYNPDGSLDITFGNGGRVITDVGAAASIRAMQIQSDGKIIVAGDAAEGDFVLARYTTNGILDSTFGSGGYVLTDVGGGSVIGPIVEGAGALLIESDSKYVAAGTGNGGAGFELVRYTTNGVLDTTFGTGGLVFTAIPGFTTADAESIGIQAGNGTIANPDKIVAAGTAFGGTNSIGAMVRYNLDGSLETNFGGTGIVTANFGGFKTASGKAVVVQGAGIQPRKITIAGFIQTSATNGDYAIARYNAGGTLDSTFGGGTGISTLSFGPEAGDFALTMIAQGGKFVLGGESVMNPLNPFVTAMSAARVNSDGSLDTTFGNSGSVTVDVSGRSAAEAVALQPNGKIVVAGQDFTGRSVFALARYNSDGSLDSAFGTHGRVTTVLTGSNAVANAVAVQPDGKILAGGYSFIGPNTFQEFALVRYNADGTLDSSFGTNGQVLNLFGGVLDTARGIALQPDGKIILAGSGQLGTGFDSFEVARYTTNGLLDNSFGSAGEVTTSIATGESSAYGVQLQTDGKIVVAGFANVSGSTNFALVRYNPDGTLDSSFGSFGRVSTSFGAGTKAFGNGVALQPDGRIVVAGQMVNGGTGLFALARYTTNGLLDTSFGTGGEVTTQVGLTSDSANSIAILSDGKIIAAGVSQQGTFPNHAVVRYNSDGSLDSSFGFGGKVIVSFEDGSDSGTAVALDQIGRAVIVGNANSLFGVARLASEPSLEITSISPTNNGQMLLQGLGVPGSNTLLSSPTLSPAAFSSLAPVTADAGGFWQYVDTNAPAFNTQFYRLSFP